MRPHSVAVVGASPRADSFGDWALSNLLRGGYSGAIYPVNPGYEEIAGLRCWAALADLPEVPELVIFAVNDQRVEAVLDEAIAIGVAAAVIMSAMILDNDTEPPLRERVRRKVQDAGMLLCGGNGMGFYNVRDHLWACGFDSCDHVGPGKITLISHSGSGMSGLIDSEARLAINFAVSTGNELGVTMDQYIDFALDLPETRAVGLFIETARNPTGFRDALAKAQARNIPVVALKVGRTEKAAQLTVSHSGAMAGDSATYDALFDRYGVHQVRDMDELATLLIMFGELHPVGPGGLVSLHDSGGERQLMVDLADAAGVELTALQDYTVKAIEKIIDPELPAVNPLDAWSRGGENAARQMQDSFSLMLQDHGAAIGVVAHDRAPDGVIYQSYLRYMEYAHATSGKPVALVAARQGSGSDPSVVDATRRGLPVLDGLPVFLRGVRALFDQRDFQSMPVQSQTTRLPVDLVSRWQEELRNSAALGEARSLALLDECGIPVNTGRIVNNRTELPAVAAELGFPLVAKTAMPGIAHKSEHGGVLLNLQDDGALAAAYDNLAAACGPVVLIAPMLSAGVEMILGARRDPQFGPVIVLGFGGIHAELLKDVAFALPPFSPEWAERCINQLKLRPLLDGVRGMPAANIASFCETASRFSVLVHELRDVLFEADINPLIVNADGCIAADALLVGEGKQS
ncbi:MAG: acetate--CoA ligase family protein [Woeseia sp.]